MNWSWVLAAVVVVLGAFLLLGGRKDVTEAKRLVAEGARLVDVRTPGEYASGHVDGAVNVPVDEIGRRTSELGSKDAPLVLYCRSGARSARAKAILEKAGFTNVVDAGAMSNF